MYLIRRKLRVRKNYEETARARNRVSFFLGLVNLFKYIFFSSKGYFRTSVMETKKKKNVSSRQLRVLSKVFKRDA